MSLLSPRKSQPSIVLFNRMITMTMILLLFLVTFLSALPASTSFSTSIPLQSDPSSSSSSDRQPGSSSSRSGPPQSTVISSPSSVLGASSVNTTEIVYAEDRENVNVVNSRDVNLSNQLLEARTDFLEKNGNTAAASTATSSSPLTTTTSTTTEDDTRSSSNVKLKNTAVAIILNTNARRVKKDLVTVAQDVLGEDYVHVTTTAEEARAAARRILQQNVSLVVPVGGDGTLSSMVNFLCQERIRQQAEENNNHDTARNPTTSGSNSPNHSKKQQGQPMTMEQAVQSLPFMGYIPFGTGNGVGSVVGCNVPTKRRRPIMSAIVTMLRRLIGRRTERLQQQDLRQVLELLVQVGNKMKYTHSSTASGDNSGSGSYGGTHDIATATVINGEAAASFTHHEGKGEGAGAGDALEDDPLDLVHLVEMPMMELTTGQQLEGCGDLCFFAGVGFDSLMLQDFKVIKAWSQRTNILTSALSSVTGYVVALVTHTLPKCVSRSAHQVRVQISTRDPDTLWVDHRRGDVVQRVSLDYTSRSSSSSTKKQKITTSFMSRRGSAKNHRNNNDKNEVLLYKGIAGIVAAGTSPFYGGGLRLFPFARMTTDKMHLRIGRIHPLRGFVNIPGIFAGSYRDTRESTYGCIDFMGDDFDVTILPANDDNNDTVVGYPLQHSGEAVGSCEHFRLRVVKEPIRFVTFLDKRLVNEEETLSSS
jgi:hypothetical protein